MNLQETFSKMYGRKVTKAEARKLADDQFGMLATWLREQNPVFNEDELDTLITCVQNRVSREYQARNEGYEYEDQLIIGLEALSQKLNDYLSASLRVQTPA